MEYAEERTPSGRTLKIMYKKGMFLLFNEKGEPVYSDSEGRSMLHKTPMIVFVGTSFSADRDYDREYTLLKISEGRIILPFRDVIEKQRKYLFLDTDLQSDVIPSEIRLVSGYSSMLRDIPTDISIDYLIVDSTLNETEIAVVTSRYKPGKLLRTARISEVEEVVVSTSKEIDYMNINTMSDNPVFLALMHLKKMSLSNLNQLLLDFDISALDIQYILFFIDDILKNRAGDSDVKKNINMLSDLQNAFSFYLALIQRDEAVVKEKIDMETDLKKLSPYQTLVSKVRSMNPGREDQLLFTEYENMVLEKKEQLLAAGASR